MGCFSLQFHSILHHQGKSGQELSRGRNPEEGDDAQTMDWYCFSDLLSMAWSSCFHRMAPCKELGSPTWVINQENTPEANLVGHFSYLWFLLPKWLQLVSSWHKATQHTADTLFFSRTTLLSLFLHTSGNHQSAFISMNFYSSKNLTECNYTVSVLLNLAYST